MKETNRTLNLVQTAILSAVILIMAFTPLGYIRTLGLSITLIVIPVAVGAIILGPKGGAVLGMIFGITSFAQCFGMNPFGSALLMLNPLKTFILCIVPRVLVGLFTGLVYQGMKRTRAKKFAVAAAAFLCPVFNTVLYMSCLVVFFYQTDYIQQFVKTLGAGNPFMFVVLFVGINAVLEAVSCLLIGTSVAGALMKIKRRV